MVLFSNLFNAQRIHPFGSVSVPLIMILETPRLGLLFRTGAHTDLNASTVPSSIGGF
jgi:hypothetical protein